MAVMETHVLVFPLAADENGIMLIEPEPWQHGPVQDGVGVDGTVQAVLFGHGVADPAPLVVHSTSWHEVRERHFQRGVSVPRYTQVDAYLAVLELPVPYTVVEQRWPAAIPVEPGALALVGHPPEHGPTLPPVEVMQAHALLLGLRHLALQLSDIGDSEIRDALAGTPWPRHLADMRPELARMYRHDLRALTAG